MESLIIGIFCFVIGFVIACIVCARIHTRHSEAWKLEYCRLMSGINKASVDIYRQTRGMHPGNGLVKFINKIRSDLDKIYEDRK